MALVKALNRRLADALALICAALLTVMVCAVFVQVLARYVFVASTPWAEEVAVYCFIWVVLLGTSIGVRTGQHLVADLLPGTLGTAGDKILLSFGYAISVLVAFIFVRYGADYAVLGLRRASISMGFPMFYIYVSMPISGVAMALFLFENIHDLWSKGRAA